MPLLVVLLPQERPPPKTLRRLEHQYPLAAEPPPAWVVKPFGLTRHEGRIILIIAAGPVSPWTSFLSGAASGRSIWQDFYKSRLVWRRPSATSISAV
jgi:hypothetical protein